VIWIIPSERAQTCEMMVQIRHCEMHPHNLRNGTESGFWRLFILGT
jgi:hypothetical protein